MSPAEVFALVAGGTVQAGGGVYLPRRADDELLAHCSAGSFTYILTSRQMGKSSLMIRTAERLFAERVQPVVIDLTEFGAQTTAEQWYKGILSAIQDQLVLHTPAAEWWDAQSHHAFGYRFTRYLREVALAQRRERLVIFVDEIDTTLRLDFTDDFFAAIRFLYQNRAADPVLQRLSFVLIGVATPGDLIKDATRTPFNIGHRIDLTDFTADEALSLAAYLPAPERLRNALIGWILRWTGGHPYLTLRAVRSLAESPPAEWSADAIDQRIRHLFLRAGADSDSNLQFVRDMLTKKAFDREAVLRTYGNIRRGERVPDKELDQVASWLKLAGIVCRRDGVLSVRNAIYEHVFDERWARDHLKLNVNWRRRLARLAAVLLVLTVLVTIPLAIFAWRQKIEAEYQAAQAVLERDEAEYQAAQAVLERDEAERQRLIAETSMRDSLVALSTADKPIEELKRYNPASAAAIEQQIASARADAQKEFEQRMSELRAERDDALKKLELTRRALAAAGRPPQPQKAAAHLEIEKLLEAYKAAYTAKDIDALRRVQALSSSEARAIRNELAAASQYRVSLEKADIKVSPDGRTATVTADVHRTITGTRGGSGFNRENGVKVFALERRKDAWVIVSVR
jgi:hypothetical protein